MIIIQCEFRCRRQQLCRITFQLLECHIFSWFLHVMTIDCASLAPTMANALKHESSPTHVVVRRADEASRIHVSVVVIIILIIII